MLLEKKCGHQDDDAKKKKIEDNNNQDINNYQNYDHNFIIVLNQLNYVRKTTQNSSQSPKTRWKWAVVSDATACNSKK